MTKPGYTADQLKRWRKDNHALVEAAKASGLMVRHKAFGTDPSNPSLPVMLAEADDRASDLYPGPPEDGG